MSKFHNAGYAGGFFLRLGNINQMTDELVQREKTYTGLQIFFTTLSLAIGLLHLILFAFFPRLKQNLYFAFFLFSYAATIFFDYQILLSSNSADQLFAFRLLLNKQYNPSKSTQYVTFLSHNPLECCKSKV